MMMMEQAQQRLLGDLRNAMRDAEDLVKAGAGEASAKISQARNRLSGALDSAKATYFKVQDTTRDTVRATDRCIRDHPYQTLSTAFGLGLLAGILMMRK